MKLKQMLEGWFHLSGNGTIAKMRVIMLPLALFIIRFIYLGNH